MFRLNSVCLYNKSKVKFCLSILKVLRKILVIQCLYKLILIRTIAEGGKRSVFICNTIALARQQFEVIKNFTNLKCGVFTGDMDIDNWKRDKWENELDKFQVN